MIQIQGDCGHLAGGRMGVARSGVLDVFGAAELHVVDLWSPAVLLEVILPARVVDGRAAAFALALHMRKRLVLVAAEGAAWSLRSERRRNLRSERRHRRTVSSGVVAKRRPTDEPRERRESRSVVAEDIHRFCGAEAASKHRTARRFRSRGLFFAGFRPGKVVVDLGQRAIENEVSLAVPVTFHTISEQKRDETKPTSTLTASESNKMRPWVTLFRT